MQDRCKMGHQRQRRLPFKYKNTLDFSRVFTGSPKGTRTPATAVRGRHHQFECKARHASTRLGDAVQVFVFK